MTSSFYAAARSPDGEGWTVAIDPESAGWTYSSLRAATLAPGASVTFATGQSEWIVLPLAGSFVVTCANETFELEGRHSVFSRVSDFCYVPRDAEVTIASAKGGRVRPSREPEQIESCPRATVQLRTCRWRFAVPARRRGSAIILPRQEHSKPIG